MLSSKSPKSKGRSVLSYVKQLASTKKLKIQNSVQTLISNTGLKMQNLYVHSKNYVQEFFEIIEKPPEFFCDWLTFAGNKVSEENLTTLLSEILIGGYWSKTFDCEQYDSNLALFRGGPKFTYIYKNEIGISLKVRVIENEEIKINSKGKVIEDESRKTHQVLLSLSGKVLEQLFKRNDIHSIAKFVDFCVKLNLHITRIDLSIDDYQKKLKILEVKQWVEEGHFKGFQTFTIHQSGGKVKGQTRTKIKGVTVVCGSRESDFCGRFYDTFVKHKKKAIRFEGEFKDKKAKAIQDSFIGYCENFDCIHAMSNDEKAIEETKKELVLWCKNILLNSLKFCDISQGKRVDSRIEYPLLKKWSNWLNYLSERFEELKLVVCQRLRNSRDKWDWLEKQVKGTLSLFKIGLSKEILFKLIDLLLKIDANKERPTIINQDRKLMIASMQRNGIHSIFDEKETQQIFNEYGIEFHSQSSYYSPIIKEDAMTANKKILRSLLKDNELESENKERLKEELNNPLERNNYFHSVSAESADIKEVKTLLPNSEVNYPNLGLWQNICDNRIKRIKDIDK